MQCCLLAVLRMKIVANNTILIATRGLLQMQDNKVVSFYFPLYVWSLAAHDFDRKASYEGVRVLLYLTEKCVRKRRPLCSFSFLTGLPKACSIQSLQICEQSLCFPATVSLASKLSSNRVHPDLAMKIPPVQSQKKPLSESTFPLCFPFSDFTHWPLCLISVGDTSSSLE